MTNPFNGKRTDRASRIINASPENIYKALIDPKAVATWRPPEGMKCTVHSFEPQEGGNFRMAFEYTNTNHKVGGKTSEHADVFHGKFLQLLPDKRVIESVEFESNDPAFTEPMKVITILTPLSEGTKVTIICEDVPAAINPEDHERE